MILAKARLIGDLNGRVRVGLSFPTGFDPEEVIPESVKGNGTVTADGFRVPPRNGGVVDIFRELEVSFVREAVLPDGDEGGSLKITGQLRRGLTFSASVSRVKTPFVRRSDH